MRYLGLTVLILKYLFIISRRPLVLFMNFNRVQLFYVCIFVFACAFFCPAESHSEINSKMISFRFQDDQKTLEGYEWTIDPNTLKQLLPLNRNLHPVLRYGGPPENIVTVLQGEYGLLSRDQDSTRVLSSFGAGPCIILILYDKENGVSMLAHLDTLTMVDDSISEMLSNFSVSNIKNIEAKLFSGAPDNTLMQKTLLTLQSNKIDVVEFSRQMNIAVDTQGQLFDLNIIHPLTLCA